MWQKQILGAPTSRLWGGNHLAPALLRYLHISEDLLKQLLDKPKEAQLFDIKLDTTDFRRGAVNFVL